MNNSKKVGYDYIINNYSGCEQLERYSKRVFEKGLSEIEEYFLIVNCLITDKILDVGTGCGRFAINAYKIGYKVMYAIDMNLKFIEKAKEIAKNKKYNIKFSVQNAQKTTFGNNTFNEVFFTSDGFSQIPGNENKLIVLNEIFRIMKPNGLFILAVIDEQLVRENDPYYARWIDDSRKNEIWKTHNFYDENDIYIGDGGYMHFASIEETTGLLIKSGFEILNNVTAKDILNRKDKRSSNISRFFVLRK